ncbi:beta-lactamase family protein [Nocardioides sp. J2M5]|uniref:serine hydrolase domain-containing protein n=1 Tax=Nocardioides palaemonis TaxID=2829810 RepID=UPI001BA86A91|nr:serine hydrolase domain-containing protein [Nocardioides palaemonis]MBS2936602.1 beta-lactamase family protein [Nocardioides palaemonis]
MTGLEAALRPFADSGDVPGVVAAVARGSDVEVVALGVRGPDGAPMRRDSIVRGASITKPVMAVLAMVLVEDGLVGLDDPVAGLLPELAEPRVLRTPTSGLDDTVPADRPVTLRHLLTSTWGSGFTTIDSPVVPRLVEDLGQASMDVAAVPPPDEWARRLAAIPLIHQPGEGWTYNLSYDVLGVLLARAAGRPLGDLLAERVLDRLGMADTGFHVPAESLDRFTALHGLVDGYLQVTDPVDGAFVAPPAFPSVAGGLVTTVDDQLAFGRMLLAGGDDLLTDESVRLVMTDHTTPQQREMGGFFLDGQGWGFGGGVDTTVRESWNVVGRYGWVGGTGTATYVDPVHDVVSVALAQVELGAPGIEDLLKAFWTAVSP